MTDDRAVHSGRESDQPDRKVLWESIYRSGSQLNLYPHDQVVSWFGGRFPTAESRSGVRVLDLGCGAGNNLWFLARAGFPCAGIDISAAAIDFASARLRREGLTVRLEVGSFDSLPFETGSFDIVLDRGGLAAVDLETASAALAEAGRVLGPGGTLLFTPFAEGTRMAASKGRLIGHLWSRSDVERVLPPPGWRITQWMRAEKRAERGDGDVRIEWWIEALRCGGAA